ncbi:MAG: thioredoxin domain-containing protein [Pseudomonadota bacterium]
MNALHKIAAAACLTAFASALVLPASGTAQDLSNPKSDFAKDIPAQGWQTQTERTDRGHLIGNPEADAQLIEFISYTCSHCADFAKQSDGTLDLAAIGPGFVSVEVRPVIRNSLDLVVTMMAQCGDADGFIRRHRSFLYTQDKWLKKAINAPQSQRAIWARADAEARLNAARSLDFDDLMLSKGLSLQQINACLADDNAAQAIMAADSADRSEFGITGTPTFAFNGKKLENVSDWPALSAVLQEAFRPKPQESVTGG